MSSLKKYPICSISVLFSTSGSIYLPLVIQTLTCVYNCYNAIARQAIGMKYRTWTSRELFGAISA